jgi:hypothetical protein
MSEAEERRALGLYVVAARDVMDFLDMLREPETTLGSLEFLQAMFATPNPQMSAEDAKLNALLLPFVTSELERRKS